MNPLKIGIAASVLAVAMVLTEVLWQPIFTVQLTSNIALPLWLLAAVYGGLQLFLWRLTRQKLSLTAEELTTWGPKLEEATPTILSDYEAHKPVAEIATTVESAHGIPRDVTLRYIIALGQHLRRGGDATA